ncbi:MAG: MFS transporter [Candidatus Micrarchaeota archaeon]
MSFKELIVRKEIRATLLTLMLTSIGFGVILPIIPFYSQQFGATPTDLGLLTAIFAFLNLVFAPLIGKFSDKIGRKKVLQAGTLGFIGAYLLFAFAPNLEVLFIARALEGIMAAGIFPSVASLISDFTTEQQRGKAMALVGMTFSLGFILGPALGGLAELLSIQGAFFLAAALSFINFLSVTFQITEPKEKAESREIVQKEISLLQHISSPLLFCFVASFMIASLTGGMQAVLALFTELRLDFGPGEVGIIFTILGVLIMLFQFLSGSLVGKYGEVRLIQAGLFLSSLGFLFLVFLHDWLTILLPLSVFVLGNALVFPSVSSLVSKRAQGKRGAALGLLSSFQSAGQVFGPITAGFLYHIRPEYAFYGLAAIVLVYFVIFSSATNNCAASLQDGKK